MFSVRLTRGCLRRTGSDGERRKSAASSSSYSSSTSERGNLVLPRREIGLLKK